MANWAKSFSQEEQDKLKELKNKFWADAVAEWIKTLWKTDEVRDRIKATQSQTPAVDNVVKPQDVEDKPTIVEEVKTEEGKAPTQDVKVEDKPTIVKDVKTPSPTNKVVKTEPIKEDRVRQALQLSASKGLGINESVNKVKEAFLNRGQDISTFETDFASTISEFEQFDTSSDDFFSGLQSGTQYPSFVKNSANYKAWEKAFNSYQAQDKSEQGIFLWLKSNSIDPVVLNKMKLDPNLSEIISKANTRIVKERVRDGEIESLYDLPVGQQTVALNVMLEDLGLNADNWKKIEEDNTLATNSKAYIETVEGLNTLYKERAGVRADIDRKYPNASEAFKNAMFNRESWAIQDKIDEKEIEASTYKTTYDFRLGEIKTGIDLDSEQLKFKAEIFRDVQRNNYSTFLQELKQADKETVSNFQFLSPEKWVIASVNKQTWDVEFIYTKNVKEVETASGQKVAETITTAWGVKIWGLGTDLRESNYVTKFPNNASFKNNNPAWLTAWVSDNLKGMLENAGISITDWTNRPTNEWGKYINFETLDDGLSAMKIAFYDTGWTDVRSRLEAWKGAGTEEEKKAYVDKIMNDTFGSTENRQFNSLSSLEKEQLLVQHLKREDGALYGVLSKEMWALKEDGTLDYSKLRTESTSTSGDVALVAWLTVEIFGSRASDWEREAIQTIVQAMPWASRDDIIWAVRGFKFNNDEEAKYWATLLKTARITQWLSDIDLPWLSSLIRGGQKSLALNKMEVGVDKSIKAVEGENYISESNTKQIYSKVNELNELIKELEKIDGNPIGNFEGTLDGWLGRFKWAEATKIKAKATFLVSKMRKDLIGANITATETATLDGIIPEISDSTENFLIKTESLKSDSLSNLNAQRERYWLATLSEGSLLDLNKRVEAYEWTLEENVIEEEEEEELLNKNSINWPIQIKQSPREDLFWFWVASITSAATAPLEVWALLSRTYLSEDKTPSVEETLRTISWENQDFTPLELFNFVEDKVSLRTLANTLYSVSQLGTNEDDLGTTLGQALTSADANITKAVYSELGINSEATSTKVWEILSADILYWGNLLTKWVKLTSWKLVWTVINKLDKKIEGQFIKGIKPASIWDNAVQQEKYKNKARQAVFTITRNKEGLSLTDELWDVVKGKTPKSVHQFSQAVSQVKSGIYKQYHELAEQAWTKVNVDLNPIIKELEIFKNSRAVKDLPNSKELNNYIDGIVKWFKEEKWARQILDVESLKQGFNARLNNFYKNPNQNATSNANVDALVNNLLGKQLDGAIESVGGSQYSLLKNQYWALSTIEKDVARAAIREAKKSNANLVDHSAIFSARDLLAAWATWTALPVAKAATTQWFVAYFKHINSPDVAIKNMFQNSEKALFGK